MRRRIAVTGATGFIGRRLAAHLEACGRDVRAIVRPGSPRAAPPGVSVLQAPLEERALRQAFDGVEAVVHLAGVVSARDPRLYTTVNVEGTREVARAAAAAGARLIHVSSLAAAGPAPASAPRSEDDPSRPINPYGESKLASERVVEGIERLGWVILRPGVVYGPGDRALLPLFRMARRGWLPLIGPPDTAYSFVQVDDLVAVIDTAVDAPHDRETVFVGHPAPVTMDRLAEALQAAFERRVSVVRIPDAVAHVALVASDIVMALTGRALPLTRRRFREMSSGGFVCRVDRLRDRLGYAPRIDLKDGIAHTLEWYRREGWL